MTAQNPEGVLEDDEDELGTGALTLATGVLLATIIVAGQILGLGVAVETYALVMTVLGVGAALRFAEVLRS